MLIQHPDPAVRWLDADETHTNSKEFISLKNDLDTFINTFDDYARSQNVSFTDAVKAKKAEIAANGTEITKYGCSLHSFVIYMFLICISLDVTLW